MAEFAVGDLLKITLISLFDNTEENNNVFWYHVESINTTDPVENTLSLAGKAVWTAIKDELRGIVTPIMKYVLIKSTIVDRTTLSEDLTMDYNIPTAEQLGLVAGDALPPYATYTYRYNRPSSQFRHGYKRFSGIPEASQANGYVVGAELPDVEALALPLQADLNVESGIGSGTPGVIRPCLVRSVKNSQLVRPVDVYFPSSVQYNGIGTQSTRKYGRGS